MVNRVESALQLDYHVIKIEIIDHNIIEIFLKNDMNKTHIVKFKENPSCDCLDFIYRHTRCKHIYYVLHKVLGFSLDKLDIKIYKNKTVQQKIDKLVKDNICIETIDSVSLSTSDDEDNYEQFFSKRNKAKNILYK